MGKALGLIPCNETECQKKNPMDPQAIQWGEKGTPGVLRDSKKG